MQLPAIVCAYTLGLGLGSEIGFRGGLLVAFLCVVVERLAAKRDADKQGLLSQQQ